jgi:quercetin dioxygenase-like cupin family protein
MSIGPLIKASDMETFDEVPGAELRYARLDQHGLPMTVSVTSYPPGTVTGEHRHPSCQAFIVFEGRGIYTVDGVDVIVEAGDMVVVPSNALHGFRVDGDVPLRHVGIYERR